MKEVLKQIWKEGDMYTKGMIKKRDHASYSKKEIRRRQRIIGVYHYCTRYKVYVEILKNKLEKEVEKKN